MGIDELGGSLIQNGGTLILYPDNVGQKTYVGQFAEEDSSWILNGNATILYDDPLGANGNGLDNDGTGKDFEVGESVLPGASGRMELHDNAVLRVSDDLKLADGDGGTSFFVMDGNSKATIGSGISVDNISSISVSGSALLVTGNSADPGDNVQGRTNEGYLTLSSGATDEITVEISENGAIYARTLQMRQGVSVMNLTGNGQFFIRV